MSRGDMDVVSVFTELAAIPSASGHEADVAAYVSRQLRALGLEVREDAFGRPGGSGNLLCRLPARSEALPRLFCAHLDTVPPDGVIRPSIEGGFVRNANGSILGADNKAAVAVMLAMTERLIDERPPHGEVELLFTVQEEIGLQGAKAFDCRQLRARAGFVFDDASPIGHIIVRAPFQENLEATFRGKAAHAGIAPERGRSAIVAASRAVCAMRHGRIDRDTTANVGVIKGGTARNIVAERCAIEVDIRSYEGARARELLGEFEAQCRHAAAQERCKLDIAAFEGYPGYTLKASDPAVRMARDALSACGHKPELEVSGGGVDANVLNAQGIPTANLGNGMRDIHTSNERIAVEDLSAMVEVALALATAGDGT